MPLHRKAHATPKTVAVSTSPPYRCQWVESGSRFEAPLTSADARQRGRAEEREPSRQPPFCLLHPFAQARARRAFREREEMERRPIGDLRAKFRFVEIAVDPQLEHACEMDQQGARELLAIDFAAEPLA